MPGRRGEAATRAPGALHGVRLFRSEEPSSLPIVGNALAPFSRMLYVCYAHSAMSQTDMISLNH
ncbi:hypothetical protein XAC3810_130117 [Xanthomonas citri pv. citri]|nr:hypothetical protein XAC9322_140048 [Xanthomonas citri pv. citri]CEE25136.1 hypothetical protein XAC902_150076 [Xanthomonas citri pv. citri]CEE25567.1 hypothetical protein XAC3810_130117 [Xanthomonas citri pv. citri]CEE31891.1 hypothetical protein XAC908_220046 [Xanthomonas citri pv. citri]CEE57144.1 hypothetical protein XACS584_170034 [Xanthomonas citri pv. citri]